MNKPSVYIALLAALIILAGFLTDLATTENLVVAIIYNVPIALSGLALSRRLTVITVLAALAANALAGVVNLWGLGAEPIVILNRVIAGLSYLLVAYMTLALRDASVRVTSLVFEEARAKREHDLREMLSALSGPLQAEALLQRAARGVRELLGAESVVISGFGRNRFVPPRYSDPEATSFAGDADAVLWAVAATPTREPPVMNARLDVGRVSVGRWRRQGEADLVVMAKDPRAEEPALLLGEALRSLEPLLERAKLFGDVAAQRQELEERNNVIRDLVYAFSHDLRTPLMANAVTMRHALEGAYGELNDDFKRTLTNGLSANEDLLELADSLLLIARFESGEVVSGVEPVDLGKLMRQVVEQLEPVWRDKGLDVKVDAPGELRALGRASELRRVFQNLLDNAVRYSPTGGAVVLRAGRDDEGSSAQGVRFEVTDQGSGISEAQEARLFKRFSSGRAGGGKGLGLYLARQIVEAHGGRISYSSADEGGSRFSVWLPVAKEVVTA